MKTIEALAKGAMKPATTPAPTPAPTWDIEGIPSVPQPSEIKRLDDLRTDHMTKAQAAGYKRTLDQIRAARYSPDFSGLVLTSPDVGIGKTHIARAIADSYGYTHQAGFESHARFFVAPELIAPEDGKFSLEPLKGQKTHKTVSQFAPNITDYVAIRCVVIDDVGREGVLRYVKAEQQREELESRYFQVINHIYTMSPRPVLIITTNKNRAEFASFFNDAARSRLFELIPAGNMISLGGFPDYRRVKSGRGQHDQIS